MIREYMLEFGYTDKEINKILLSSIIVKLKEETIYRKIKEISNFFLKLGYNNKEIIKIIKLHPRILGLTVENLKKKIDDLIDLGYDMTIIKRISIKCPQIYSLSIENIENKTNEIIELGYTRKEILLMIKIYPTLYAFNLLNMKYKINEIMKLGYSYDDIINMTKIFPQLYSLGIDNIRDKVDFCNYMGIPDLVMKKKKILVQSVELSYARYMFYKSIGIDIDIKNCEKLFDSDKVFFARYKKHNDELLELYKYDKSNIRVKAKKLTN